MTQHILTTVVSDTHTPSTIGRFAIINVLLLATIAGCFLWYFIQMNGLASSSWRVRDLQEELSAVQSRRDALIASAAALEDRESLAALARTAGLMPADTVSYVIEPQPVAAR